MFLDGREPDDVQMAQSVWAAVNGISGANSDPVVLLGHSAGGHTVLEAALLRPDQTLGVALISPVGIQPHRAVGNEWGYCNVIRPLAKLSVQPPWRTLLGAVFAAVLRLSALLSAPQRMTADELLHTQQRTALYDFVRATANAEALASPVLHAYARDDPLIQPERASELLELLDRDVRRDGPRLSWDVGGHYIQQTHAPELAEALEDWVLSDLLRLSGGCVGGSAHVASALSRRAVVITQLLSTRQPPLQEPPPPQQLVLSLLPGRSGALCLPVRVGGSRFECAVDTGSPFLLLPSQPSVEAASVEVLPPTTEIYGANKVGTVSWRDTARLSLSPDDTRRAVGGSRCHGNGGDSSGGGGIVCKGGGSRGGGSRGGGSRGGISEGGTSEGGVVFGASGSDLLMESGGPLVGLIRDVNNAAAGATWVPARPTLLGQARRALGFDVAAFRLDARARQLTLSASALIDSATDALPLVDPRRYGDGVAHYAVRVERLRLDGTAVRTRRPILAVFDSGLTGCVFSQSFVDEMPELADYIRATPSRTRLGRIDLTMRTERGRACTLRAGRETSPLFYTQGVELNWFAGGGPSIARARAALAVLGVPADASAPPSGEGNVAVRTIFNARGVRRGSPPRAPHVIALGQAFLGQAVLTVDIDGRRAMLG